MQGNKGEDNKLHIKPRLVDFHINPQESDRSLHGGLGRETELWHPHTDFNYHF